MDIELQNVTEIINLIKEMAPSIWDAYYAQVAIEARTSMLWFWFFAVAFLVFFLISVICFVVSFDAYRDTFDWRVSSTVFLILSLVLAGMSLVNISYSWKYTTNPDYYAIKWIIEGFGR